MNNLHGQGIETNNTHLESSHNINPLDESLSESRRSSARNSVLNNKPNKSKIVIERKQFDKLLNFLKLVVKELNMEDKELRFLDEFIQTEGKENFTLEQGNKTNKTDFALEMIEEYDMRIRVLEDNINKEQEKNMKLNDELKICKILKEEAITDLEDCKLKSQRDQDYIISLRLELDHIGIENAQLKERLKTNPLNRNERMNRLDLEKNQLESNKDISSQIQLSDSFSVLENEKLLFNIASYLKPLDYFNFCHSSKIITSTLNKTELSAQMLKYSIWYKNVLLNSNKDFTKEYEITEYEIERLLRDYIQNEKVPGLDLKNQLVKALSYIEKEIKTPLGLNTRKSGILTSINNMFNKLRKSDKNKSDKNLINIKNSSNNIYENINDYDKMIVQENLVKNDEIENIYFDFNSADEIKNLLVQFFTSLKNSPTIITNFIAELINEYSDFIFYTQKTLLEIKELDIVKSAMHERFKKYHKICIELENELDDLQKFAKTNKEIKDILLKQKLEVEVKYTDSMTQITYLKDELNKTANKLMTITEKYNRIEQEHENFKNKLVKEFKFLRNQYDSVEQERDVLKDAILEFKKYFMRFHITEDGEIAYIETTEN